MHKYTHVGLIMIWILYIYHISFQNITFAIVCNKRTNDHLFGKVEQVDTWRFMARYRSSTQHPKTHSEAGPDVTLILWHSCSKSYVLLLLKLSFSVACVGHCIVLLSYIYYKCGFVVYNLCIRYSYIAITVYMNNYVIGMMGIVI